MSNLVFQTGSLAELIPKAIHGQLDIIATRYFAGPSEIDQDPHAFGLRTGAPGRVAVAGNRAQGRQRAPATPEMLRTRVKTDASGGRDQLDLMPLPQQIGKHRSSQYDCPLEVGVAF